MHSSLSHTSFEFRSAWSVLSRHRWVVAGFVLAFAALALLLNAVTRPVYRSAARIEIKAAPSRSALTGETIESMSQLSENLALSTTAELVTNRVLMERLAESLTAGGVPLAESHTGGNGQPGSRSWLDALPFVGRKPAEDPADRIQRDVDWLLKSVSVRPVRDTRLVDIQAEHSKPELAAEIANTTAQMFVDFQTGRRSSADHTRLAYLENQIGEVRRIIQTSEQMLYGTREANPVMLQGRTKQLSEAMSEANTSYYKARTERLTLEAQLERARAFRIDSTRSAGSLPIQTPALDELHRQLLLAETDLAKAGHIYRDRSPELDAMGSQVTALRTSLRRELDKAIADLTEERETLLARERSLRLAAGENEQGLRSMSNRTYQYSTLESELGTNRELYNLLLKKAQEERVAQSIQPALVELVVPARTPLRQSRPRKALNLALGVLVGMVSGSGAAFALEALRRTIRTPNDVVHMLHLPVMGMIPKRL